MNIKIEIESVTYFNYTDGDNLYTADNVKNEYYDEYLKYKENDEFHDFDEFLEDIYNIVNIGAMYKIQTNLYDYDIEDIYYVDDENKYVYDTPEAVYFKHNDEIKPIGKLRYLTYLSLIKVLQRYVNKQIKK